METLNITMELPKRPFLTHEQLDWAESVGLTPQRAYWLASCPKNTKIGTNDRPQREYRLNENRYIWKAGNVYMFRIKRTGVKITKSLSRDLNEARKMRDIIEAEMNLKPIFKFIP